MHELSADFFLVNIIILLTVSAMIRVAMAMLPSLSMRSTPERFTVSYKSCAQCTPLLIERCMCRSVTFLRLSVDRESRTPSTHW